MERADEPGGSDSVCFAVAVTVVVPSRIARRHLLPVFAAKKSEDSLQTGLLFCPRFDLGCPLDPCFRFAGKAEQVIGAAPG